MSTTNHISQVIQIIYCVIGLLGQTISLVIFTRSSMRSSYVFLLVGLASFDFLTLVKGLLSALKVLGSIDYDVSSVGMFFFRWICDLGTKYFTVLIAAERYFVICHPIKSIKWKNQSRGAILSVSTLIFIAVMACFSYVFRHHILDASSLKPDLIYKSVLLSFIPFTLVILLSLRLCFEICKFNNKKNDLGKSENKEISATKMLLTVTSFFSLCVFFEVTRRLMEFAGHYKPGTDYYDYTISHLSDHFYLLNSTANIVIYGIMYRRFREEFRKVFCCNYEDLPVKVSESTGTNQTSNSTPVA